MREWWLYAACWGSLAALASAVVLIAVVFVAPYAFLSDYPADIRSRAPVPTRAQRRLGTIGGLLFVLSLLGAVGGVLWGWQISHPGAGFIELALMAFVVLVIFAVLDIVVVDWLIICTWRPRRLVYPGTEECFGWRDYGFHVRQQVRLRGLAVLVGGGALPGFLVWMLG